MPTPPSPPPVERNLWQRLKRVAPWLAGHRFVWTLAVLGVIVASATEPAIPALMKPLLDTGFHNVNLTLWEIPVILLMLFGLRGGAVFLSGYCLARATNHAMERIRQRLFEKLLRVDPSLFQLKQASSLTNTMVYEVNNGANLLLSTVLSAARDLLTLVALLGYLLVLNWKLTLIVFCIFPPIAWVVKHVSRRLDQVTRAGQDATEDLAYVVEENVLAYRMVRLHNAQPDQAARFADANRKLRDLSLKAFIANSTMTPVTQILAALALSAVISVALWQSSQSPVGQGVTVGAFAAFITGMLMLISPIKYMSEVAGILTRGVTALERGLDLLDVAADEHSGSYRAEQVHGELRFEHVSLQYPEASQPALKDIVLRIQPGQTVALVGASGSGKTTLANLVPRFLEPSAGHITLDGVPLNAWALSSLRQHIALVSQDVVMLNDTLAKNIALGQPVDTPRIWQALEAANLADFVRQLPQQENTCVGHNATQLSGGQRQRLAIARAIYKNAPLLILDEATSALDTASEQAVKDALKVLMRGRTSLVIAHRLSTIEHADMIVVMQSGHIVEQGTHAELIARQGAYWALHQSVFTQSNSDPVVA